MLDSLKKLIADLKAADKGNRELDFAIARVIFDWRPWRNGDSPNPSALWVDAAGVWRQVPFWTSSIDAALSLVPEGWTIELTITSIESFCTIRNMDYQNPLCRPVYSDDIATAPLAICAAALKARTSA